MSVRDEAAAIAGEIAELRHAIHREPEIGVDLPKTQRKVLDALDGLPLEVSTGTALTSVTAVLRGAKPGPAVLLRGDMDALPVTEATGVQFASRIDGVMHACGHDLHTAMLAGAARLLSARQADLPGSVIFMFQPGEEGQGGARLMIEEGVLDAAGERPGAAPGLHVVFDPEAPGGVSTRPRPPMAAAGGPRAGAPGRRVRLWGVLPPRRFDVFDPVVVTVGSFHAGTVNNVIPDEAVFHATLRSFSEGSRSRLETESARIVHHVAEAHG